MATATGVDAGRGHGPGAGGPATWARPPSGCWPRRSAGDAAGGEPDRRHGGAHAARDRRRGGAGLAGPQAGPARRAARPGHPAGGPLPAAPGHREPAAGHRHAHHPGRAGPGARRAARPTGRCWSAPTTSAATSARSPRSWPRAGWPRWSRCGCGRATRCGSCWPSGCPTRRRSWPGWAGSARPSTSTTGSGSRRTAPPTGRSSCSPGGWSGSAPSSPTSSSCWPRGSGPREAIVEGEVVAYDAAAGELRPFGEVMLRRRKHGIDQAVRDVPVGLFCFELLYADGEDLTRLPYPQRRAALAAALTLSARLRLTTAVRGRRPGRAGCGVRAGGHRRLRGPGVQVDRPGLRLPGRQPAAGSGSSSSGTTGPSCPTPPTWSSSARSPGGAAAPGVTARCCWPPTTRTPTCSAR